jgi:HEAT repeat protein
MTAIVALCAQALPSGQSRTGDAAVQVLRQAIFEAEDRRAPGEADLKVLVDGTRYPDEAVQRQAVRALGRLERPALVRDIEPLLASRFASVRAAAAEAIGQALEAGPSDQVGAAALALSKRLGVERDRSVVGALCETIGRLPYGSAEAARSAEVTLLVALLPIDRPASTPLEIPLGVAKGLESLLRRSAKLFTPSAETVRRLRQLAIDRYHARSAEEAERAARVRRLATAALASARQADGK